MAVAEPTEQSNKSDIKATSAVQRYEAQVELLARSSLHYELSRLLAGKVSKFMCVCSLLTLLGQNPDTSSSAQTMKGQFGSQQLNAGNPMYSLIVRTIPGAIINALFG